MLRVDVPSTPKSRIQTIKCLFKITKFVKYDRWSYHFTTCRLCMFPVGNIYNIPVCLWLLDTYPYNPPICFVKPTSAMMIKTGKHIDANGKIYLPYLHEWKHVSMMNQCI